MLEQVFRDEWGRVLASLVGFLGDVELAEDVVQDAFATAAERWPRHGIPANPTGWLRLQGVGSATTVRHQQGRTLLTDGPFVDSKDFLGGFIIVEAENLDGALAVAGELQELQGAGAIEVRPVREGPVVDA